MLITLQTFSQNDTVTDSLICLPKSYLISAVQDIESYDYCRAELREAYTIIDLKDAELYKKDAIIAREQDITNSYQREIADLNNVIYVKDEQINLYLKKARVERTKRIAILTAGGAVVLGGMIGLVIAAF
jgi:hypothetical protein